MVWRTSSPRTGVENELVSRNCTRGFIPNGDVQDDDLRGVIGYGVHPRSFQPRFPLTFFAPELLRTVQDTAQITQPTSSSLLLADARVGPSLFTDHVRLIRIE